MARKGRSKPNRAIWLRGQVAVGPKVIPIGQATETDIAQPLGSGRRVILGQAVETDIANPLVGLKIVTETDTAFSIRRVRTKRLNTIASETDTAFAITKKKRFNLTQVTESEFAFSIIPVKSSQPTPPGTHLYELELRDLSGALILADLPFDDLRYGFTLDGLPWAEFSIDMWKPEATTTNLAEGQREVRIKRDGVLVWGGYLWTAEVSTDTQLVRCQCEGWFSMFYHRLIDQDKIFEDVEQFDIAWQILNYTQGLTDGNLGVTRGPEANSGQVKTKKYRYWERQNVAEAINELSEMQDGFDYDIAPNKVFHMYYPRRGSLLATNFEMDVNVNNVYVLRDARELVTEVHGIGGGEEKATCIAVVVDTGARATYKLRQEAHDFGNIKHFNTMVKRTTRWLNNHKAPTRQPQVGVVLTPPDLFTFNIGDRAPVIASAGYLQINATYRIIAIEVFLDQTGVEVVTVHFDERTAP
jgi:hypothetical protein